MEGVRWILQLNSAAKGLSVITALLSCTLLFSLFFYLQKPSRKPLPGPFALPVIGHLHLLGLQPHHSLARMSLRYGPLFSLRLGSAPLVVASSPEAARQILQTHDQAFAYRPPLVSVNHIFGTYTGMTFSQPGPFMKFLRHLFATELFSFHRLERFKPIRTDEVRALLRSVYADDTISTSATENCIPDQEVETHTSQASPPVTSRLINIRPLLQKTANNIISRMAIGETSASVVLQPVLETLEVLSKMDVSDFLPWIQWADLQGCQKQSKKAALKMRTALQQIIEQRREKRGGMYEPPADILDILLSAALTCPKDLQLADAHIRAILVDIYGGGSDTSALVVEWAMAELLANPIQMNKTQEEIENVVSRKPSSQNMVEEADIQNMPYLQAVVKETMRLHPILPLLLPRETGSACRVLGFDIPAKTRAFVNVWAIGRDPKVWDSPNEFCPQRFLGCNIDARGQHFEFLPFGAGRRACPGLKLGLVSIHIILASLLHMFFWTPHDAGHDMSEKFGILTVKARPLLARATPKLASGFYN